MNPSKNEHNMNRKQRADGSRFQVNVAHVTTECGRTTSKLAHGLKKHPNQIWTCKKHLQEAEKMFLSQIAAIRTDLGTLTTYHPIHVPVYSQNLTICSWLYMRPQKRDFFTRRFNLIETTLCRFRSLVDLSSKNIKD